MGPTIAEVIFWIVAGIIAMGVFAFFNCGDEDCGEIEMNEYQARDISRAECAWERSLR